jgi:hypothetical protein
LPVIPELTDPLKGVDVVYLVLAQVLHHISCVDVDDNQRVQRYWLVFRKLLSHQLHWYVQLIGKLLKILFYSSPLYLLFNLQRPVDLRTVQDTLPWMHQNPVFSWLHWVIFYWI